MIDGFKDTMLAVNRFGGEMKLLKYEIGHYLLRDEKVWLVGIGRMYPQLNVKDMIWYLINILLRHYHIHFDFQIQIKTLKSVRIYNVVL